MVFHNNEEAFERALEKGDIFKVTKNNKEFFGYRALTAGHEVGRNTISSVTGEKKALSDNQLELMHSKMDGFDWSFQPTGAEVKMLCDKGRMPVSVEKQFHEAGR